MGGETITLTDAVPGLVVIPPVSLRFASDVQIFKPNETRRVSITVTPARSSTGRLALHAPAGWKVSPPQTFQAAVMLTFTVTAPAAPGAATLAAVATVGAIDYGTERIDIRYAHIPRILLQPPASLHAVCLHLAIAGQRVGYLPGAGDSIDRALAQMGYEVVSLAGKDLTPAGLKGLGAVVIGVRAFNVRTDLADHLSNLWAYVQNGGTVVEQYNTPRGLQCPLAPFTLTLNDHLPAWRVTDEHSPVTLLAPDHPALNQPNKIGPADFDGWVQERGLDFPDHWDAQLVPLLACSDPGEAPLQSGLLVGHYGRGWFVYTGLSFFRQLPAGVPGAYRLFANLVSLGQ
jgi:hypothetical protein